MNELGWTCEYRCVHTQKEQMHQISRDSTKNRIVWTHDVRDAIRQASRTQAPYVLKRHASLPRNSCENKESQYHAANEDSFEPKCSSPQ